MRNTGFLIVSVICSLTFSSALWGADATDKDAMALVEKGIKFIKDNGKEKAFAAFQDSTGEFIRGELYLFSYDFNGVCLEHGQKPKLVGKNRLDVEDVNGKKYIQEMVTLAKTKGSGWVDYMFQNPETKKVEPKTSYFKVVEGADYFIACGIYKK
jgi:signal transduction histidine kinase